MSENSSWSTSLPTLGSVSLFNFSHSNECAVLSPCGFNLYFPNDYLCRTYFHVHICHSYIFLGELSVQIFGLILNQVAWFVIIEFEYSLYMLSACIKMQAFYTVCNLQILFPNQWLVFLFSYEYLVKISP